MWQRGQRFVVTEWRRVRANNPTNRAHSRAEARVEEQTKERRANRYRSEERLNLAGCDRDARWWLQSGRNQYHENNGADDAPKQ